MNSSVIEFTQARLDEEEAEAAGVITLNGTDTWRFDDGIARSERESERRFGGRCKVAVHESVTGCHTHIDWAGDWPAVSNEMRFIARFDPARVIAQVHYFRYLLEMHELGQLPDFVLEEAVSMWRDHPDYRKEWPK